MPLASTTLKDGHPQTIAGCQFEVPEYFYWTANSQRDQQGKVEAVKPPLRPWYQVNLFITDKIQEDKTWSHEKDIQNKWPVGLFRMSTTTRLTSANTWTSFIKMNISWVPWKKCDGEAVLKRWHRNTGSRGESGVNGWIWKEFHISSQNYLIMATITIMNITMITPWPCSRSWSWPRPRSWTFSWTSEHSIGNTINLVLPNKKAI